MGSTRAGPLARLLYAVLSPFVNRKPGARQGRVFGTRLIGFAVWTLHEIPLSVRAEVGIQLPRLGPSVTQ